MLSTLWKLQSRWDKHFEDNSFYEGSYYNFKEEDCLHSRIQTTAIQKKWLLAYAVILPSWWFVRKHGIPPAICLLYWYDLLAKSMYYGIYYIPEWITDWHRIWGRKNQMHCPYFCFLCKRKFSKICYHQNNQKAIRNKIECLRSNLPVPVNLYLWSFHYYHLEIQ